MSAMQTPPDSQHLKDLSELRTTVRHLRARCLITLEGYKQISEQLNAMIETEIAGPEERADKCPYTFSHTRSWCGYSTCRTS